MPKNNNIIMSLITYFKGVLIQRGSVIAGIIISVIIAIIYERERFSWAFICDKLLSKFCNCLDAMSCSIFSICCRKSKVEKLRDMYERYNTDYELLNSVDPQEPTEIGEFNRIKTVHNNISIILN